jgi:hypothetical protein
VSLLRRPRPRPSGSTRPDRGEVPARLSAHARTAAALEAWADGYGDAFIPVLDQPGVRDVGLVRGLRSGVPFELRCWIDAPRADDSSGTGPIGFTIEIRAAAMGFVPTEGFRRRRRHLPTGDPFTAAFTGDVGRIGPGARTALLDTAAVATALRYEHGSLVVASRDPVLHPPRLDAPPPGAQPLGAASLDGLLTRVVDAIRALTAAA